MNKYFIGWPVPESLVLELQLAQSCIQRFLKPETKILPPSEFHITALFIGKATPEHAQGVFRVLQSGPPILTSLSMVSNFNNKTGPHALVILVNDHAMRLQAVHNELQMAHGSRSTWSYSPHLTLAKSDTVDLGIVPAALALNNENVFDNVRVMLDKVVLYEKCPGDAEYHVHTVVESEKP